MRRFLSVASVDKDYDDDEDHGDFDTDVGDDNDDGSDDDEDDENLIYRTLLLTGRRHDGDRRFIKWTRVFLKASWLNIRRKCCKACGTGTQERYCLI